MKLLLITFFFTIWRLSRPCPSSWAVYSQNDEPFQPSQGYHFSISRLLVFRCKNQSAMFYTKRTLRFSESQFVSCQIVNSTECESECNRILATVFVRCMSLSNNVPTLRSTHHELYYIKRNCNKLYWTNWSTNSQCSISGYTNQSRSCVDCDGKTFPFQQYCPGVTSKQEPCHPSWSEWVTGNCSSTNCDSKGEQIRIRKCLYRDGNEASNTRLCSNQCFPDVKDCDNTKNTLHITPTTNYIIAGVVVCFLLMIIFVLAFMCVKYHCKKSEASSSVHDQNNEDILSPNSITAVNANTNKDVTTYDNVKIANNLADNKKRHHIYDNLQW